MSWIDDVLGFWFDELRPEDWWRGSPDVDARVRERFAPLHERLARDPPDPATLDARGHLASVIVFDQFSRHLQRDAAAAYANDAAAVAIALDAIDRGLDRSLDEAQRRFLYMPLMHAEDASLQERSVALFATLGDREALGYAKGHRETIARFGRFPARNAALGRASTDAERARLARGRSRSD